MTPPDGANENAEGLIEPINGGELELLRLLAARRSIQEIADEMFISVNTVKWHARNLYGMIGMARNWLARNDSSPRSSVPEDGLPRTLEEMGREFHVTLERIRQIEGKALRMLRHLSRRRKLKDYLE